MAWNIERPATTEDTQRHEAAVIAFAQKHCEYTGSDADEAQEAINREIEQHKMYTGKVSPLKAQYNRTVRKALDSNTATGIAYGYVGRHSD